MASFRPLLPLQRATFDRVSRAGGVLHEEKAPTALGGSIAARGGQHRTVCACIATAGLRSWLSGAERGGGQHLAGVLHGGGPQRAAAGQ